jgi:hypothetical protein
VTIFEPAAVRTVTFVPADTAGTAWPSWVLRLTCAVPRALTFAVPSFLPAT